MLEVLDAAALRLWCRTSLDLLGREREHIDALNVFPVADADTGTNMFLTVEAACEAIEAGAALHPADFAAALHDLAHGAFLGARGNSGVILSQILRGMADAVAPGPAGATSVAGLTVGATSRAGSGTDTTRRAGRAGAASVDVAGVGGKLLGVALARASRAAYAAVAAPVDGTILTVARDVADAVTLARSDDLGVVAQVALTAATESLARTPDQMELLRRHGVVDAGGAGLVLLLSALVEVVTGVVPTAAARSWESARTTERLVGDERRPTSADSPATQSSRAAIELRSGALGWPVQPPAVPPLGLHESRIGAQRGSAPPTHTSTPGHAYEVMFLLEAPEALLPVFRSTLATLGDSLLVVGGDELWNVHIHADDVGAVIEAGLLAGRPYRIRVSHLTIRIPGEPTDGCTEPVTRAVVLLVEGEGVAALAREAGAIAIAVAAGATASTSAVVAAVREQAVGEVVVIPGSERFRSVADAAAQELRGTGARASVVPVRAAVQALAALAVHDPLRRFDDDVVAMTAAAGATRFGTVTIADTRGMTSAGVCEPGDVLALLDGDVVVISTAAEDAARSLVDRLLGGGGELVTLVHADDGASVARGVRRELRAARPDVECVVYAAGATSDLLLVGVE